MGLFSVWVVILMGLTLAVEAVEQTNITVSPGDTVTLPCTVPHNRKFPALEWDRTDLGSEYVVLHRDNQSDPEEQHMAIKDRVALNDWNIMNGDFSMILKNVTTADSGTYQCKVYREKGEFEVLNEINLCVRFPDPADEKKRSGDNGDGKKEGINAGLIVLLLVIAVIFIVGLVAGIVSYKKKQQQNNIY